jgi:hypothetical protein
MVAKRMGVLEASSYRHCQLPKVVQRPGHHSLSRTLHLAKY